jgi:benzoyl-CoA reductase/2-hydroxyglutaryl-CoA dehydratase subunit BcrC/BadD/HgdB
MLDEIIDNFARLREVNLIKVKDAKENGRKVVGIYCTYCPQELILAAGAIPVSLCGTKEDPIAAAEETLPRNLCPLIKSSFGFAVTDTCPFFHFSDLIIGETTCDGKKKMFEILNDIKPVHVMQLPHLNNTEASFDLWVNELHRLKSFLEHNLNVKINDDDIWGAIDMVNRETAAAKAVCDLNQMDPPPLTGLDLLTVTWSRGFAADKGEIIDMLHGLKKTADAARSGVSKRKPRILLTGCPVGLGTEKVIRLVQELGANVVAMENCSGYKTLELQTSHEYDDPIVALAHKYIRIPCSCMSPNSYRMDLLQRMIEKFRADAVIDLTWQACHTYNVEAYTVGKLVKDKGLPYLHLESDYSNSDWESLKVRIEAMLEMVEK